MCIYAERFQRVRTGCTASRLPLKSSWAAGLLVRQAPNVHSIIIVIIIVIIIIISIITIIISSRKPLSFQPILG